MNFDSIEFLFIFLPFVVLFFWFLVKLEKKILATYFLIGSSLFFYSYIEIKFLPLILFSIFFNFFLSNIIRKSKKILKKKYLVLGILINILILLIFKYSNFIIEIINQVFNSSFSNYNLIFPIALSFYTLQQITYLVDTFEDSKLKVSLSKYFLYVSFFPQLLAGPIVLFRQINEQWDEFYKVQNIFANIFMGLFLIFIGLFKKIIISQKFSIMADMGFNNYENISLVSAWISSLCFTMQFYFDFSAYSDIAIGLGLLFNIKLPINFNSPFKSLSITEFWTRWHITLSNFINYYMYMPTLKLYNNLTLNKSVLSTILIMGIIGLWHGPSINYLVFGLLHRFALGLNTYFRHSKIALISKLNIKTKKIFFWLITFLFINLTFIYFRSETLLQANQMVLSLFGLNTIYEPDVLINYIKSSFIPKIILFSFFLIFCRNSSEILSTLKINVKSTIILSFLMIIVTYVIIYSLSNANKFIYMNF